jgi:hypothetical protein
VAKAQTPTQASFVEGLSATVKSDSLFTNAEWTGVINNIVIAFNDRYENSVETLQDNMFKPAFASGRTTIIVVKNPAFEKYSTTINGDTVYINHAILNDKDALGLALENVGRIMNGATNRDPEV